MLKQAYVAAMQHGASAADRVGVTDRLARADGRFARHMLSLLAIYDLDRMVELDRPWWVYRSADEVEAFLLGRHKASVFEFGAGASTFWLARRAGTVHSVEHDEAFGEQLESRLDAVPNVTLHRVAAGKRTASSTATSERAGYAESDFGEYVATIADVGGSFDLIVIDGRARSACLEAAAAYLAADGIVVFDNSDRSRYRDAIGTSGLVERRLHGWCPSLPNRSTTSLLTRPGS